MTSYYIGLMSGTSMDAADAAAVAFDTNGMPHIAATHALAMPVPLRDQLPALMQPRAEASLARFGAINQQLGDWFADAALRVMADGNIKADEVAAIGSHGQTLWHEPEAALPFSVQLGAPGRIAARTGCRVITDFRNADMAVGGQGAPLVPAFHRYVFAHDERARIVVNIGGIANITVLPAGADRDGSRVTGFDTGPGNTLMDGWILQQQGHAMDHGGQWAASGQVHTPLLNHMLHDPYLQRQAPKSTGREYFNMDWLQQQLAKLEGDTLEPGDVQATLCEFTARSIADTIKRDSPDGAEIFVCGGGAHNPVLIQRLSTLLAPRSVSPTSTHGLDADWVEAVAFAWLAMRRDHGLPGNLPGVTGARRLAVLGGIHAPPL